MTNKKSDVPTTFNIFSYYTSLELERHNFDFETFCQKHHIRKQNLFNQQDRLPLDVVIDLAKIANELIENKLWHLEYRRQVPIGAFRHIDFIIDTSINFNQALEKITKYIGFLNEALAVKVTHGPNDFSVNTELHYPIPEPVIKCIHESLFKGLVDILNLYAEKPCPPKAIFLKNPPNASISEYNKYFSCPLYFNSAEDKIVYENKALNTPMKHGDPVLHKLIQLQLETDMDSLNIPYDRNISEYVKSYILTNLTEKAPKVQEAAQNMGMSTRSLQRALQHADTSYVKLLDEVRLQLATKYLSCGSTPLADISFHLGFADQSSFNRVFKKWTGQPPLQYKNTHNKPELAQATGN